MPRIGRAPALSTAVELNTNGRPISHAWLGRREVGKFYRLNASFAPVILRILGGVCLTGWCVRNTKIRAAQRSIWVNWAPSFRGSNIQKNDRTFKLMTDFDTILARPIKAPQYSNKMKDCLPALQRLRSGSLRSLQCLKNRWSL
jgi:hypothetical protein